VYYATRTGGPFEAWMRDGSGAAPAKLTLSAAARHRHVFPTSVSHDGKLLAYTESGGSTGGDVKVAELSNGSTVVSIDTPFDETHGVLSPDARLLAYQSDESGRPEIYLVKLDDRQRIPVSSSGGRDPMWSTDGASLVYRTQAATMRVAIDTTGHPAGAPVAIAAAPDATLVGIAGDRILARVGGDTPPAHAVLTLEWSRDLQRILGPPATPLPR